MAAKRPVLKIPLTPIEQALEGLAIIALVANLLNILLSWGSLPNQIPVHFNVAGNPDRYGDKGSLLVLPLFGLILYVGLTVLSRFPQTFNYPFRISTQNAARQYLLARLLLGWLKTEISWFLAYIAWQVILVGQAKATDVGFLFVPIFVLIIFGTIGIYIWRAYKVR